MEKMKLSFRQRFAIYMCPKSRFDGIHFYIFNDTFNNISILLQFGVGILSTRRKPQTCRVTTDNLYHVLLYRVHLDMSLLRTRNISADRH